MVARTRFELVISALRGRCPKPLDERAMLWMAGVEGFEPPHTEPESGVLPLDDTPLAIEYACHAKLDGQARVGILLIFFSFVKGKSQKIFLQGLCVRILLCFC